MRRVFTLRIFVKYLIYNTIKIEFYEFIYVIPLYENLSFEHTMF